MERVAQEMWLHGEFQTFHRWIIALPSAVVREHAHFVLTAALYLLHAFASTSQEQGGRIRARAQTEQMIARVEEALQSQRDEQGRLERSSASLADEAKLQQRLRILRAWWAADDAALRNDQMQLRLLYQQMQCLERDDELVWQMIPLSVTFNFRAILLHEDTSLIPIFLEAKQRVSQTRDRFAIIQVMHWLAHLYRHAGRLHQAYQEALAALDMIAQANGHAFLAAYFSFHQANILYQWNRLNEARTELQIVLQHSLLWHKIDLLTWGYRLLLGIERAAGNLPAAKQALQELERLHMQRLIVRESVLIEARLQWWLATGDLAAASDQAAQIMFHPRLRGTRRNRRSRRPHSSQRRGSI